MSCPHHTPNIAAEPPWFWRHVHFRLPHRLLLGCVLLLVLNTACVLDRTGQSRSMGLQDDLAGTKVQVDAIQRQVDDQLTSTSAKLVEVQENAQLSRRNLADSEALLDMLMSELQALRGLVEALGYRMARDEERSTRLQDDSNFRLKELEKRLAVIEGVASALTEASSEANADREGAVQSDEPLETGETLSAEDTLAKAQSYVDAGRHSVAQAFLRGFPRKYPDSPLREQAQFLLGESLRMDQQYTEAIQAYQLMIEGFSQSSMVPMAMLRQGEAFLGLGAEEDAKVFFEELVRAYPKSDAATLARSHLQKSRE